MSDNKNLATSPPATGENPEQKKSFMQRYGGSIVQMIFFWLVMKTVTGGWYSLHFWMTAKSNPIWLQVSANLQLKLSTTMHLPLRTENPSLSNLPLYLAQQHFAITLMASQTMCSIILTPRSLSATCQRLLYLFGSWAHLWKSLFSSARMSISATMKQSPISLHLIFIMANNSKLGNIVLIFLPQR